MNWFAVLLDLFLLGVIALCAWRGNKNGIIVSVLSIAGIVACICAGNVMAETYDDEFASVPQSVGSGLVDSYATKLLTADYSEIIEGEDDDLVIRTHTFDIQAGYVATAQALRKGTQFTAVFSISDIMAIGAMRALREAGLDVPGDCSVIAIDGLEFTDYIHPQLSTLCQPKGEMGRRSVDILLDMIQGHGHHRQETLPTVFRAGASVRYTK